MKIGIFTDNYLPGVDGVTTSVEGCKRALEKRGHEVYVLAPKHPNYKDKRKNIYRLTSVELPNSSGTRMALQLPEMALLRVLKINFDIIHGHPGGGGATFVGLEIARLRNIPYVATYHTLFNRYTHYFFNGKIISPKMAERLSKFVCNLSDCMIAPTERVKEELISYGVTKPIHILPSGIDVENYKNVEKGFLRKKIKVSKNKKILLYVGRLGKEKSVDFLIETFQFVRQQNPNTVLVLVGDGPDREQLKELAQKLGLTEQIHFLGAISHRSIPKIYADANLFVFASQTETQGMVVLEALASSLPVVAVEDDAFHKVIINEKNGYLVKRDPKIFAEKIGKLLTNEELYNTFSLEAEKTAEQFSTEKMAKYLEEIYEKLIREKGEKSKRVQFKSQTFMDFFTRVNDQVKRYYTKIDQL